MGAARLDWHLCCETRTLVTELVAYVAALVAGTISGPKLRGLRWINITLNRTYTTYVP